MYATTPPWDIGRPQPAFLALAEASAIQGRVLDVGCGTGEHRLQLWRPETCSPEPRLLRRGRWFRSNAPFEARSSRGEPVHRVGSLGAIEPAIQHTR